MQAQVGKRYIYSAYATSVSAVLHKPLKAFLSDAPSVATPAIGGLVSQSKERVTFRVDSQQLLSAGRSSATVLGERRDDHYMTLATCTVENLNILDIITADAVVSKVTAVFPATDNRKDNENPAFHKATFHLAGSHFRNLKINGKPIVCETGPEFERPDGFKIKKAETRHHSLFTDAYKPITIPQFGTIHLGEVDIYSSKVILTMLRVELGSPYVGSKTVGTASSNGTDD